jgi:hypothetical protein
MAGLLPQEEEQAGSQEILGLPGLIMEVGEQIFALALSGRSLAAAHGTLPRIFRLGEGLTSIKRP